MTVRVLWNGECGHCRRCVERVRALGEEAGVPVEAVDVRDRPDEAARLGAETSPLLVFDDGVAIAGVPDAATFAALAGAR